MERERVLRQPDHLELDEAAGKRTLLSFTEANNLVFTRTCFAH